jgi:hypothetical protein
MILLRALFHTLDVELLLGSLQHDSGVCSTSAKE